VAPQKSKRSSRKRRNRTSVPRAAVSTKRDERAERRADAARELRRGRRQLGREGSRPESPFGGLPVSEIAILIGIVGAVIGFIQGGGPVVIVAIIVCALGVLEICGREHFSGYRSHTILLAAIPSLGAETAIVAIFGAPGHRLLLLVVVVPLYALLFWLLRRRFLTARQARVARPPTP
jgi:Flp pilus assembly protein TadB